MSLSVERLEELADNEAACAESLLNCRDYDYDEDLKTERQARLDTEAGLRELIAIKEAEPVATVCGHSYPVPEGVSFSSKDWDKLYALQAGTQLIIKPE